MIEKGRESLRQHAVECDACRAAPPPIDRIADLLDRSGDAVPQFTSASRRVVAAVGPLLQAMALRRYRRQVAAAVAFALTPLPFILAYDAYLLRLLHAAASALLGWSLATYLVASHAACLLFLLAASYAAIPILLARGALPRPLAGT